jgi:hypothetical protein
MGATLTVNSEQSTQMIRLVGDKLVQEESQRNLYVVPPKGEYVFAITGYALPFQMAIGEQYRKADGPTHQTMTRLELTIAEGKGAGKMFTVMLGFSLGPKSNLGRLLRQMNVDLSPDENNKWDLDRAIGYRGKGYVVPSDTLDDDKKPKYAKISIETVEPVSAPEQTYSIQIEETASANGATNGHTPADDGWE